MQIFRRGWVFLVLITFLSVQYGMSQSTNAKKGSVIINKGRPDIPGELGFDLGLVIPSFSDTMKVSQFHCTYISPFYKYEIFIPHTHFSIVTGLSLGLEKYRFNQPLTIEKKLDNRGNFVDHLVRLDTVLIYTRIKSSKLAVNYLQIPVEIRFRTNKTYPKNSFMISVGGEVGFMINGHTKYKYTQAGNTQTVKLRDQFDLTPIRYGFIGRLGFGNFNFFYYQSLNTLFEKGKLPAANESQPMQVGISLSLF